ncbi:hypothetical protein GRX03_14360 [Halovenus sp. WSH3]|uniref:Sjogrens syndrome scleroderma autoantigen 1 n=1 Tax=Halovenus carboxidivorans TaxID=2692199 RepID=A0A6B0TAY8_9EURY|nr:Sjogren's syndrome/scleroderma autoantigen 1 family protein [Halovenus carboxidivorans]MXR52783.1 hypothetical protein [Halovenus carboxidivorans]
MSEDFDKEAEREKLREKYERDKQKRQATEQMSELLLQGATMTNAHCSECGDPIFRYEGQEFCPTCEKPVDRGQDESEDDEGDGIQVTTPDDDARVAFGDGEQATEEETAEQADQPAGDDERADPRRISTETEQDSREQSPPRQQTPQQSGSQPTPDQQRPSQSNGRQPNRQPSRSAASGQAAGSPSPGTAEPSEASVAAARESLVRTLTRFSRQAAATDDPSRAQEHLAAAREAAEALAALRQ